MPSSSHKQSRDGSPPIGARKNRNMRKDTPYSRQRSQSICDNEEEYRMGMRESVRGGEYDTVDDLPTERIGIALQQQALQTKLEVLGARHPDTMTMMVDLVHTWYSQCYYRKAEPIAIQILELRREVFGPSHSGMRVAMHDLAITWIDMGRCGDAENLATQLLEENANSWRETSRLY